MKNIHITESQLKYCLEKINEAKGVTPIDVTNAFTQDGNQFGTNTKKTIDNAEQNGLNKDEMTVSVNGSALEENCECYTKKQLKEARLKKLMKESRKVLKKKDL